MFDFLKKKKLNNDPVAFTHLVKEGANFVIIFAEDTFLNYEIMQYCANWDTRFKQFNFLMPEYSCGFFSHIRSFTNASFQEIGSTLNLTEPAIILNLSPASGIRKQMYKYKSSLLIDSANTGNLHFLPSITGARDLFFQFSRFFNLELRKKAIEFTFTDKEIKSTGHHLFQNNFLNFLLDNKQIDQTTLKQIIINIKQNFPSNIYLNGQLLKKHEFINLKNLPAMTLLDKYLFASNCDLLISDDLESVKLFSDLNLKQLCIAVQEAPGSVPSVSLHNIHVIKDAIAAVLEK